MTLVDIRLDIYPRVCWSFRVGWKHLIIDFGRLNLYIRLGE